MTETHAAERATRTMTRRQLYLLAAYQELARPLLLDWMLPNGCIAATRVTLDVFAYFGVVGRPLVVQADVFNPRFAALFAKLKRPPTEQEALACSDVYLVTIGYPRDGEARQVDPDSTMWCGHLVALLTLQDGRHMLVDPTLDQAARPDHDIAVPGVVLTQVPPAFVKYQEAHPHVLPGGVVVRYAPRRAFEPYHHAPDWIEGRAKYGPLTVKLIRTLEAA
jgi:hypothetical protein